VRIGDVMAIKIAVTAVMKKIAQNTIVNPDTSSAPTEFVS
jgi:hypothetical protein